MIKVAVTRCEDYEEDRVLAAVRKCLKDADIRIPSDKKVLIKPNCLGAFTPEQAITTHPSVLRAVIILLKEKNCGVSVGESSGSVHEHPTKEALAKSGMAKVARSLKADLIPFEGERVRQVNVMGQEVGISDCINKFDLIVNLSKLKTHSLTKFTGAVKNLFGFVVGLRKAYLHSVFYKPEAFSEMLVDLYEKITPGINIMDGIIGLEGDGPGTGGTARQTGLLFASKNAFALDIVASRTIGYEPLSIFTNSIGIRRKLVDENITVAGEKTIINYKKPVIEASRLPEFLMKFITRNFFIHYPHIVPEKCTKCGACMEICPQKAIKDFHIKKKNCINCYCCSEVCPNNAIDFRISTTGAVLHEIMEIKNKMFGLFKK